MAFKKGVSGNPTGRPVGTKDRRSVFRELVETRKEELVEKAISLALCGNEQMLRLLLDRILPPKIREEPVCMEISSEGSYTEQGKKILSLITQGGITITEGNALFQSLLALIRINEADDLIKRIQKLEEIANAKK